MRLAYRWEMFVQEEAETTRTRPPLTGGSLDRDAATRMRPEALALAWAEPTARLLRLRGLAVPLTTDESGTTLGLVPTSGAYVQQRDNGEAGQLFLGRLDGAAVFAEQERAEGAGDGAGIEWRHPFEAVSVLGEDEQELVAVASALMRWHETSGFAERSGEPTHIAQGGWARLDDHGNEYFPRTDPAVIVLIEHEDRVLLGSNVLWESGRFSLLAGFVEAGESLEQAVRREVFEESGVRLGEVTYRSSQPWPFPRSLMLGFRARLADGFDPEALSPDPSEISELRWFTRAEVLNPGPGMRLPQSLSIARHLLDDWVAEGDTERAK